MKSMQSLHHCVSLKNAKFKKRRFLYVDSNLCRFLFIELWCHTNLFFFFFRNSINTCPNNNISTSNMLRVKSKESADNPKQQQQNKGTLLRK